MDQPRPSTLKTGHERPDPPGADREALRGEPRPELRYKRIEDYGIIGDLHTAALAGMDGSIDWFCYPHFDSPSVFAALLDADRGGRFRIRPTVTPIAKQLYLPDTNVLITRFLSPEGVGELRDFMPIRKDAADEYHHRIIRRVSVVRGHMDFELFCQPSFDYGRARHSVEIAAGGALFHSRGVTLSLRGSARFNKRRDGVAARFSLKEGQTASFILEGLSPSETPRRVPVEAEAEQAFHETVEYWRHWLGQCTYSGRWRETVHRSALALKLLTFGPSGAIVAAPTASLPAEIGGRRNWDYRYTWIRDASFTVYALLRIGFTKEASRFMDWVQARVNEMAPDGSLQPLYGIDGRHDLPETVLDPFEGHQGSRPVRIGNAAESQLQLDIYGALMDAVYLYNKHVTPISFDLWSKLRKLLNWVCDNWHRPDEGLWEVRSGPKHFVTSKMMCWVALDRGLRLADKRGFPADRERWLTNRDALYEEIMTKGWSESRQAFVQHYDTDALDAGCLLMPLVFFLSPTDPRMIKTLDALRRDLVSDNLVHRYRTRRTPDGLPGSDGTFSICTFWLVEALTRAGQLEEARLIFEKMLGYANHLGLYAEGIGLTGEALGNYPQAFTHLSLISAAYNLDRALGAKD
jgi:GH15 family glucan-1,4-alpha-glucosidase